MGAGKPMPMADCTRKGAGTPALSAQRLSLHLQLKWIVGTQAYEETKFDAFTVRATSGGWAATFIHLQVAYMYGQWSMADWPMCAKVVGAGGRAGGAGGRTALATLATMQVGATRAVHARLRAWAAPQ